ncbi:MAG: single-stranded DNA-binding protein [Candidatus Paraimprobicoccus trichonymphae]|uniref:Single-stranded DNA-binding protein n=1 Tax=Candidatus Paraimprobicoccus trichonymphae TaxID=3033793 RepID=A0AA48HZJ2_9FIRM|nr:MAG: single-stranded DNA-binding protein [Candidatus Paraimprobicoccus trichonymphae]
MLNTVVIMGRLTSDPELKSTSAGVSVVTLTIAVTRSYVKSGEERQTDFICVVAWRNIAEFISKYFKKGQLIAIEGSLRTRNYTDKEGNNKKVTEVIVINAHFCESKRENINSYFGNNQDNTSSDESRKNSKSGYFENNDDNFIELETVSDDLPF